MKRKSYQTDLTDAQWKRIEPHLPKPKPGGRPRSSDLRSVFNAILYVNRTGCAWRMLPGDFPPWGTVWYYFRKWRSDGTLEVLNARLREQVRRKSRRQREPRIAVIDSQSVKVSDQGGERGFDAGKKR